MIRPDELSTDDLANRFEERAEYLSEQELENWTAFTKQDRSTIRKLTGSGAKLLIGPRGSGKSTLLRSAYFRLLEKGDVLPAYINYSKSLALEPLFHKQANALQLFRQWLLLKIVVSVASALEHQESTIPLDLSELTETGKAFIRNLESGVQPAESLEPIAPSTLVEKLERWCDQLGRSRCVLLMDDAAHAFSPEQQREFFEVFRELRSRRVAGKAAVYPGITSYSPFFHVGHEAEKLEVWQRPDDESYLEDFLMLVKRRFPPGITNTLLGPHRELTEFLALASFGLPRGFLNMLGQLLGVGDEEDLKTPTRRRATRAVADYVWSLQGTFSALSSKLPRYKNFVQVGGELQQAITRDLKEFNRSKPTGPKKATVIAISEPINPELARILDLLEYAGIVRSVGTVSRGVKGVFRSYIFNYAILIKENALSLGKSYKITDVVACLRSRDAHAFKRSTGDGLLGRDFSKKCVLDLPPCRSCGAPRVSDDQKFCMKCGAELGNASVYEELLHTDISKLPITQKKIEGILEKTNIRTVQDVLLDDGQQKLRTVPYIGRVWAAKIATCAEEFVGV